MAKKASGPNSAKVLNAKSRNVRIWLPPSPHGRTLLARTCHDCGEFLPESSYYKPGYTECKSCYSAKRRARVWAQATKPRPLFHKGAVLVAATCGTCHRLLMSDAFYAQGGMPAMTRCRDCRLRASLEYEAEVFAAVREATRQNSQARRSGFQWTGPELELASRTDLTARQVATMIGRSYAAVAKMRTRLKSEPLLPHIAGTGPRIDR